MLMSIVYNFVCDVVAADSSTVSDVTITKPFLATHFARRRARSAGKSSI